MGNSEINEKYDGLYAPGARILVVDDNSMNCKLVKSLLKKTGIEVEEAFSGQECLAKTESASYDLILMDHLMPGIDGIETFRRIRAGDGPCKSIPIIALSANPDTDARELYNREGFSCFLKKPVKPTHLEQVVADFLPDELIQNYGRFGEIRSEGFNPDDYDIEGLDWDFAKIHFFDNETLKETLGNFRLMISRDADRLREYYGKLEIYQGKILNEYALSEYRVLVHSMKSSATLVGIVPLSGMAFLLEKAAIEKDTETLTSLNDIFVKNWLSYGDKLSVIFPKDEVVSFDKAEFLAHLKKLAEASEVLDIDSMDPEAKALSQIKLPWDGKKQMEDLMGAVAALDTDSIRELISKLKDDAVKMG